MSADVSWHQRASAGVGWEGGRSSSVAAPTGEGLVVVEDFGRRGDEVVVQRADEHLETIVRHLSLVVEGMVGIINAGATLRTMLPVAISLAPGLLRGASE